MLKELIIKNYALIEKLHLEFSPGLNIFTGETGAGKSIIIDALGLILGEKVQANIIRKNTDRVSVCGIFEIKNAQEIKNLLQNYNLYKNDDVLILRREIDINNKSKCYCNDEPVSLNFLCQLSNYLIDIHGQYEHQNLLKQHNQLNILDRYSGTLNLRNKVEEIYNKLQNLKEQYNSLKLTQTERQQKIDMYEFQINEIEQANLKINDEQEIDELLPQLKNAQKLIELSREICVQLSHKEDSVLTNLYNISKNIKTINNISGKFNNHIEIIEKIISQLNDITYDIETYANKLELKPEQLDKLIEKKELIFKLKEKYGPTIKDILDYHNNIKQQLTKLKNTQENIEEIEKEIYKTNQELMKFCDELSSKRKNNAIKLQELIQKEIQQLNMPNARFNIEFKIELDENNVPKINQTGYDKIMFLFSSNLGVDIKPLKEIASGGEMSRVMLAIKSVIGMSDNIPIMVFDEIDAGVSGPMGKIIGKKLYNLSKIHQILCITHLPQIAVYGEKNFYITKIVKAKNTYTEAKELNQEEKLIEISRMLSAGKITEITKQHALEILKEAKNETIY